jgi:hypothetical protein
MSENVIDNENTSKPAPDTTKPKGGSKPGRKAKPAKKAGRAKKTAGKPKTDRTNKKAEVIAMMKRAKSATLEEIVKATGWQPHTVRGFVSILGSKGRREDRVVQERRFGHAPGRRIAFAQPRIDEKTLALGASGAMPVPVSIVRPRSVAIR